ncbi:hypothetical protein TB1_028923 [Malus domestica]
MFAAIYKAQHNSEWSGTPTRHHHGNHHGNHLWQNPQPKPYHLNLQGPKPARATQTQREPNALPSRAQALHSHAPHNEQPIPMAQPAPAAQLAPKAFQTA